MLHMDAASRFVCKSPRLRATIPRTQRLQSPKPSPVAASTSTMLRRLRCCPWPRDAPQKKVKRFIGFRVETEVRRDEGEGPIVEVPFPAGCF